MPTDIKIKNILQRHQLAPSKKLGQNFLVHRQTAQRIVDLSGIKQDDIAVELGVGLGSLTLPLAAQVRQVIGIELDGGIIAYHQEAGDLPDNVNLIHQDLLKTDFGMLASQSGGPIKILANLPYSVSNPLLFKLLENRNKVAWAVLMLQKEVGQRLTAAVGTKEYGVLTVLLAGCATVEPLMQVGPAQFHPRPKVDSVVVRISFQPPPQRAAALPDHDHALLRRIVNAAFQQRRKTLCNALAAGGFHGINKEGLAELLRDIGLTPEIRAERLAIEDYVRLTRAMTSKLVQN